jgi:hypothetical protein
MACKISCLNASKSFKLKGALVSGLHYSLSGLSGLLGFSSLFCSSGFFVLFGKNNLVNYLTTLLKSRRYPSDSQS